MRTLLVAVLAVSAMGCELLGGGGGGGGGGAIDFSKGYVFVRKSDKNIYVADLKDVNTVGKLSTTGASRHPSLSRDGKRVVFSRVSGADAELLVVAATGGTPSVVLSSATTAAAKNARQPTFSPDGAVIAFAFDDGGSSAIGLVNADGSSFRKLAGGGSSSYSSPTWSADGKSVLVATGNNNTMFSGLELLDTANGTPTPVTNTFGTEAVGGVANRVVLSPDGKLAAFDARVANSSTRIFVFDLTAKKATQLTDYPSEPGANDSFPVWVGADKVGFSSDTGGNDQVYALPATAMKTSGGLVLPGATEPWFGPN